MSGRRKVERVANRERSSASERDRLLEYAVDYDVYEEEDFYDDDEVNGVDCNLDSGEEADLMEEWFANDAEQCGGLQPTSISLEETTLSDVKHALSLRTDRLEKNVTLMYKRALTEILALRKESSIFKTKVQQVLTKPAAAAPPPLSTKSPSPRRRSGRPPAQRVAAPPASVHSDTQVESYDEDEQYEMEIEFLTSDCADSVRRLPASVKTTTSPQRQKTSVKPTPKVKSETGVDAAAAVSNKNKQIAAQRTKMDIITGVPFHTLEEFLKFEEDISKDSELEDRFIDILTALHCRKKEGYAHTCWRFILTDQVAVQLCWNGTAKKMCIRELRITYAIQTAFQRRYDDDEVFVLHSQRFFRYANVRLQAVLKKQSKPQKSGKKGNKKRK